MSRFNRRLALTLTLSLIVFGVTSADDKINGKSDDTNTVAEQRVAWLREKVAGLRIVPTHESNDLCKLREEPIFKWSNPVSGAEGAIFVWTSDGRPIALAKCHLNNRKSHHVETFISISDNRLRMSESGQVTWEPSESGVKFMTLEDFGPPAGAESLRLAQMRRVVREFRFVDNWGEDSKSEWELRLMPSPLLRYSSASDKIVDGALFAFAQGTNPEALVLVEAVETDNGRVWRVAPSRLTGYQIRGWHQDRLVLDVEKIQTTIRNASLFHRLQILNPFPFPEKSE